MPSVAAAFFLAKLDVEICQGVKSVLVDALKRNAFFLAVSEKQLNWSTD